MLVMGAWHEERDFIMNTIDKTQLQNSLMQLQGQLSVGKAISQSANGSPIVLTTGQGIPVVGQIPAIALLSKALDQQNKCLEETLKILHKLLSKL